MLVVHGAQYGGQQRTACAPAIRCLNFVIDVVLNYELRGGWDHRKLGTKIG